MYKLKFTRLQNEIFRLFCIKSGIWLNQRDIAQLLDVSPTAISKSLKDLKDEGLLKIERMKGIKLLMIQLNRENRRTLSLKRAENMRMLAELSIIDIIENYFPGCSITLFGSYSLGEDVVNSDIDLAVIGSKEKDIDLTKFEKKLERRIILQFYDNFGNINKNLRNSITNGIVLNGVIEL